MSATATARRITVANPGSASWLLHAAESFAAADELSAYLSPAAVREHDLASLEARLPRAIAQPVTRQLRLRSVRDVIPEDRLNRAGSVPEMLWVLAQRARFNVRLADQLDRLRLRSFDRAVARQLRPDAEAVIGYVGSALRTFQQARRHEIRRVLDYPVAHHEVTMQVCREENELVPGFAETMQGHEQSAWRLRKYDREIDLADRIIMLSEYQRATFVAAGIDPARLSIAPLGVDLDRFSPPVKRPHRPFRVLFCGQITQRKGISYVIDGFRKAELADAELIFAGRPVGTAAPWINEPRLRYVGALPRPELAEVYRSAHAVLLPSLIEGFGATVLEGMACGVPAIVSEHTLGHDVIEDGVDGWVLPIRDADGIARRLRQLYDDSDRQVRMAAAARAKAIQFPWQRYADALRTTIDSIRGGENG